MNRTARSHLAWIVIAGAVGFASAFVFGDVLSLSRRCFLLPHATLTLAFVLAYARWSGIDLRSLWTHRIGLGALAAAIVGAVLTVNVVGQPPSAGPEGLALWFDLLWLGVVYGTVDALLLSVLPLIATWRAGARLGWTARWPARLVVAALALVASAFVTAAYHLGFEEFRGPAVAKPLVGNTIISAAQLVTASPVAAMGSHVVMHVAAVLHGPETTAQLPPHRPHPVGE